MRVVRVRMAGLLHDVVDDDVLVCDPGAALVHRLDGVPADVVRRVVREGEAEVQRDAVLEALLARGILVPTGDHDHDGRHLIGRRAVLGAAAIAGITTLVLPAAAAASSTGAGAPDGGGVSTTSTSTTVPAPTTTLPPEPTSEFELGYQPATRQVLVHWLPEPKPFSYTWAAVDITGSLGTFASGTAAADADPINLFVVPAGVTRVRIEISTLTSPPLSFTETVIA